MSVDTNASREAGSGMAANGSPPRDNLFRSLPADITLRADEGNSMPTLAGHFAVFDQWTEINSRFEGHFLERFAPGAFKKTISEGRDRIRVLFNHGQDPTVGSKVLGPIEDIGEDAKGAYYSVPMLDTTYNRDLLPGLKAKLYGASFRFGVVLEDFVQRPKPSAENPKGLSERTVREAYVREFGPVTFAAYEGATAGVRSLTDEFVNAPLLEDPERVREMIERKVSISVPRSLVDTEVADLVRDEVSRRTERLYERSSAYVSNAAWAIHPPMLEVITGIIADRRAGKRLSAEEIADRIGRRDVQPAVSPDPGVAVIDIGGSILPHGGTFDDVSSAAVSVDSLMADIKTAVASEDVKAIVLNIDSPGGSVELVPELASMIYNARDTKPIVAQVNAFAASAAYWIASSASEIVVTPSGQVGSIGVYSAHTDYSAQDEMLGEKTTLISAGKYKVEGNPYEPLSEEAAENMQAQVDSYYDMFVGAVAKGRGVKASDVRDGFGQGRMVLATQAVAEGMADRIGTLDETLARLMKMKPAPKDGAAADASMAPEPPVATTPTEPEPPVATTQTKQARGRDLFWFAETPTHLREQ